jgi:outer membrane protein assembly factor BamD (BamD/ComL family)
MKQFALILMLSTFLVPTYLLSQDRRALKAADLSYNGALRDYSKANYTEAAQKFDIVVSTIPASIDSRKYLELRLESLIKLIDIYFYKSANFSKACDYLQQYANTVSTSRNSGVLRSATLLKYLKQLQEYNNEEASQCESYQRIDGDMDNFKKTFEKEFDDE